MDFEFLSDSNAINKYINKNYDFYINDDNFDELIKKKLIYLIKKEDKILGFIVYFTDNVNNHSMITTLYLESKPLYLHFIDFVFKSGVKALSIFTDENIEQMINVKDIINTNLVYTIDYIENINKNKQKVITIYHSIKYELVQPKKILMEIYNNKNIKSINFDMEIRKNINYYYLFIDKSVKIIDTPIEKTYCRLYLIENEDKNIIYDGSIKYLSCNILNNYLLFLEPIKINLKHIKKHPFNKIQENFIKNNIGYLYIIKEREFIKSKESIYKIGCSGDVKKRFSQYPKDSSLIFYIINDDFREVEKLWIKNLNNNEKLKKRGDIGAEYFEGNYILIINELIELITYNEYI